MGGLAADTGDMKFAKVLRNTNLANLIVWSYWWPIIILSAIFLGRVWCMVCPMELVTTLGWGVRDKSLCRDCKDRSCIATANAYCLQGRSCGVGLTPANIDDNTSCLVVSGFVIYEIFTEWGLTKGLLLWTPNRIAAAFYLIPILYGSYSDNGPLDLAPLRWYARRIWCETDTRLETCRVHFTCDRD